MIAENMNFRKAALGDIEKILAFYGSCFCLLYIVK